MQTVIRTSRRLDSFLHKAAQKKIKTYSSYVLSKAYPMVPLSCRSNLAGWYVPLKGLSYEIDFENVDEN
jgi:hypothetical protein